MALMESLETAVCDAAVVAVGDRDRFYAPEGVIFLAVFYAEHGRKLLDIKRVRRNGQSCSDTL